MELDLGRPRKFANASLSGCFFFIRADPEWEQPASHSYNFLWDACERFLYRKSDTQSPLEAYIEAMTDSMDKRVNRGAYTQPFSGVGIEFDPLGLKPGRTGITLHESGFLPASDDWNFPSVFSPFWRLLYNAKHGHQLQFGARRINLTPAHIALIPPGCLFHCVGSRPVPSLWLSFSFDYRLSSEHQPPVMLKPRDTELCVMRDLKELIAADTAFEPSLAIFNHSFALLQVVLSRPELVWLPRVSENLERVRRHIKNNLGADLSNTSLAAVAGLSLIGFERAFKRGFGTTATQYVRAIRLREAAHLLLQTDQSIEDIALQTGFSSRAYLSRVFKCITGGGPAAFRRSHRQQNYGS